MPREVMEWEVMVRGVMNRQVMKRQVNERETIARAAKVRGMALPTAQTVPMLEELREWEMVQEVEARAVAARSIPPHSSQQLWNREPKSRE
mmetsp:Transcript_66430/g.131715  ORF Transcript_66430/g.131715 Transcript_66430/m.131715 type:complete len:91 (+) Transcript_66430:244-516(+)